MTDSVPPARTFTDDEVNEILAAAADRDTRAEHARAATPAAPDLDDLKRIGIQAGIAPEHVEAAARSVVARRDAGLPVRSASVAVDVRGWLGGPVTEAVWERMVLTLRQEFGGPGTTNQFGDVREWIGPDPERPVQMRVERGADGAALFLRTDHRALRRVGPALGLTFGGLSIGLGGLFALGDFAPQVVLLPIILAVLAVVSWGGTALLAPWVARRSRRRLERVIERLETLPTTAL